MHKGHFYCRVLLFPLLLGCYPGVAADTTQWDSCPLKRKTPSYCKHNGGFDQISLAHLFHDENAINNFSEDYNTLHIWEKELNGKDSYGESTDEYAHSWMHTRTEEGHVTLLFKSILIRLNDMAFFQMCFSLLGIESFHCSNKGNVTLGGSKRKSENRKHAEKELSNGVYDRFLKLSYAMFAKVSWNISLHKIVHISLQCVKKGFIEKKRIMKEKEENDEVKDKDGQEGQEGQKGQEGQEGQEGQKGVQVKEGKENIKSNTLQYFTCFLDKAAENINAVNEINRWVNPITKSCYCSEENAEPCSMENIADSNFVDHLMNNEVCNVKDAPFNEDVYIALSNFNILECKHYNRKVEKKIAIQRLYNFCKNGFRTWDNKLLYEYGNCHMTSSLKEKNKNVCIKKCNDIKTLCTNKKVDFYSYENCKKYYEHNVTMKNVYTSTFLFFEQNCSYNDPTNHGIVLCKHKEIECHFSNWTEWTSCTKTCKINEFDTHAIKTRTRFILKNAIFSGKYCNVIADDTYNLKEVTTCFELPYCEEKLNIKRTKRNISPFVIPLEEVEKANTLKELNADDNEMINDNILSNEMDALTDCKVTDMFIYKNSMGYNEKNKACSCPIYESPCYFKDVYTSQSWKTSMEKMCKYNPNLNVVTADFIIINCNMLISIKKKEIAINTYLAMTFDCHSSLFQYLFCSKTKDSAKTNFIYLVLTFVLGTISAVYLIHLAITDSDCCRAILLGFTSGRRGNKGEHAKASGKDDLISEKVGDTGNASSGSK
ncbi:conserved Plasmodium protein, unknown function [Plasmodium ovale wallikeri]|uniref:Thrombospondin-related protein 1 n=1 Tax=Plasmodium ovale wallikeri TaxID=864142 RepID=A0A1A8YKS3_PLAOA|nr:conserved Plasmodium protein, unknown function [Plasmodium ovale wallikeri]SBT32667.1 conserved Plasmodium protein, unknown function [Plasmodium ovale wallikeri]